MSHQITLRINQFEPTRIEIPQKSLSPDMLFLFDDFTIPSGATGVIYYRNALGFVEHRALTKHNTLNGFTFTPFFIIPGLTNGTIEINASDDLSYSFPILFDVEKNPAWMKWQEVAEPTVLAPNATLTLPIPANFDPPGSKIYLQAGNGVYTILDNTPTAYIGPFDILYDSSNPDNGIVITNVGSETFRTPQMTFLAYVKAPDGYVESTEEIGTKMNTVTIESVRVSGVATLNRGLSKTCGSFDRMPVADLTLYGRSGNYNTIIKSGIPVDGTWVIDGDAQFSLNQTYRWVVVRALNTTTILNYDQLFARATVYEEAE